MALTIRNYPFSAVRIQFAKADQRQVVAFGLLKAKQPFEAAFDTVGAWKQAFFDSFELVRGQTAEVTAYRPVASEFLAPIDT